jgi:hypothetical protein
MKTDQSPGRRRRVPRDIYGNPSAEAFLIVAITTILVTRLYLELAGYPQVGGGSLHIAHALWGGAAMMVALLIGWMFLGFGTRITAVVIGGIGFGLFLDEVGKFVTKDNDYFYGPSAEIMYVLVLVVLVTSRAVRLVRPPSVDEYLANSATIAADGIVHGLAPHRRATAELLLERATLLGADTTAVQGVRLLLDSAGDRHDRLYAAWQHAPNLIPAVFKSPRWVPVVGWGLVTVAALGVCLGVAQLVPGGFQLDIRGVDAAATGAAATLYLVSASITLVLALPAVLFLRPDGPLWPLRVLRVAALVFMVLNALVDFALAGFWALTHVAVGLFTMAVLSYRISVRGAALDDD